MGKIIKVCMFLVWLTVPVANAQEHAPQANIYRQNCMKCHKQMSLTMQKIFMRYLLKYSSEVAVKSAMISFLKEPDYLTSALRKDQIARYGLKNRTTLSDEALKRAIDIYWEKYKVFGKLK